MLAVGYGNIAVSKRRRRLRDYLKQKSPFVHTSAIVLRNIVYNNGIPQEYIDNELIYNDNRIIELDKLIESGEATEEEKEERASLASSYYEQLNYYISEPLTFENESAVPDLATISLIKGLEIVCDENGYKGVYNIYNENGNIMAQSEAVKTRILSAKYNTLVTGQDMFDTAETVATDDYSENLIDVYTQIVQDVSKTTTVKKFTSVVKGRNEILDKYAKGEIEVLTSMKCLDEGVDVPRSEMAIFCASTGNPRQFIQRRGRILRKHPDKHLAIIHDLVVAPEINSSMENYNMERSLLRGELNRVRDFAVLSENADFAYTELEEVLSYYNLPLF